MSHIAVYKVDFKKLNFKALKNKSFITAMQRILQEVFAVSSVEVVQADTFISLYVKGFSVIFNDNGTIDIRGSDYMMRNKAEILKKVKQSVTLAVQLHKYKRYKVVYQGNKLMATVVA